MYMYKKKRRKNRRVYMYAFYNKDWDRKMSLSNLMGPPFTRCPLVINRHRILKITLVARVTRMSSTCMHWPNLQNQNGTVQ